MQSWPRAASRRLGIRHLHDGGETWEVAETWPWLLAPRTSTVLRRNPLLGGGPGTIVRASTLHEAGGFDNFFEVGR